MTTFVFIDTNLYVRFTSQGLPGCEQDHWDKLVARVKDGSITLLVPEVVKLELERQAPATRNGVKKKLADAREQLRQCLEKNIDDTEAKEVPAAVLKSYDDLTNAKMAEMVRRHEQILQLFAGRDVKHIEFTPEIFFRGKRRQIAGRIGQHGQKNQEKDCCIVESLVHYFESSAKDAQLLFCSENHTELGLNMSPKEANRGEEKWVLHPSLADLLPRSQYFLDLSKMIAFVEQNQPVVPPEPEDIKVAVEREEEEAIEQAIRRGPRKDAEALLLAIVGIRSLIQQRLGPTSRISRSNSEKLYELVVEFECEASFLFVEELWECLRKIYTEVNELPLHPLLQRDVAARARLDNECNRFIRLSADWIDKFRATDGFSPL